MLPTLFSGELLLTDKISYRIRAPKRGEIVIFKTSQTGKNFDFIKRLIALPGDKIKVQDGSIYINNQLLNEVYLKDNEKTHGKNGFLKEGEELIIPGGEFFVLGDNRNSSSDSRDWGLVKKEEIIGKAFVIYWPLFPSKNSKGVRFISQDTYEGLGCLDNCSVDLVKNFTGFL